MTTDRPARYAKQLVSHLSRRIPGEWSAETGHGSMDFGSGTGTLEAKDHGLALSIRVPATNVEQLENVVGRHLVRFGAKDELVVIWERSDGTQGQTFRNAEDLSEGHAVGDRAESHDA